MTLNQNDSVKISLYVCDMNQNLTSTKAFIPYLMFTAVICGGLIMVIEVLGSRVIGPFFGVSLYVWTSLITVTLIALSAGYALGGIYADRSKSPDNLYYIILASGIAVLVIPLIKGIAIKYSIPLGLRGGAFVSTLVLFGPSLFLLGCVSPFLIKIAAMELKNIGRTVGSFYALSTFGSVIGTFLTGFFLIAYLGVDSIFWATGLMLILLALGYFIFFRKKLILAVGLIIPFLITPVETPLSHVAEDGTNINTVFVKDSFYGRVSVVDYQFGDQHIRDFMIDGLIQGGVDMSNDMSIYKYSYFLQFLPVLLNPEGKRSLVIGLGAGLVPRWYEQQGITTDVVDIDPLVVEVAKNYFNFKNTGEIAVEDARYFLSNSKHQYDYMVLDVFNGDLTPGHLVSLEAFELMSQKLSPTGILAMNLIGSVAGESYMTASIIKTLASVFDNVEVFPTFIPDDGPQDGKANSNDGVGNLTVVAYQGKKLSFDVNNVRHDMIHPRISAEIVASMGQQFKFDTSQPAMILTDDYNPIDFYDVRLREKIRERLIDQLNWDLLI